jgi:hypothetical protein
LVAARQYDISDAAIVDRVLAAVRDRDAREVEQLKQPLGPGAAGPLAAAYWTLPGWYEKALLAWIACSARDSGDARLAALFDDLPAIPTSCPAPRS